jgi:alpha-galactosidase
VRRLGREALRQRAGRLAAYIGLAGDGEAAFATLAGTLVEAASGAPDSLAAYRDAIERLRITRAWSQFLPLEVLGSHVGPSPNPITGRRLSMDFRAKVALFGHMGVEADPARMSDKERATLAAHIALYKGWRGVLHSGQLHRLAHPDPGVTGMMVTHEDKALALVAQTGFAASFDVAPIRLAGLELQARYRVTLPQPWPPKGRHYLAKPEQWRDGLTLSGAALMMHGLALPLTHPETAWLIALERLPA